MNIPIFDTNYQWNVLFTLNRFLDGMTWGLGLCAGALIFVLITRIIGRSKDKS